MTEILINDNDRRIQYTATGGETSIPYDFPIFASGDLKVEFQATAGAAKTTLTEGVDYTVNNVGAEAGGDITLTVAATLNEVYTLTGDTIVERVTDFPQRGEYRAASINLELDRLAVMMQEARRDIDRAVRIAPEDTTAEADLVLPLLDARKAKLAGWNSSTGAFEATSVTVAQINQVIGGAIANASNQMADGGESAPGLPFLNDTDTGFYRPAADQLGISLGALNRALLTTTSLTLQSRAASLFALNVKSNVSANAAVAAQLGLFGHSAAAVEREYARLEAEIVDNTNAAEIGKIVLKALLAGSFVDVLSLIPNGTSVLLTNANGGLEIQSTAPGANGVILKTRHNSASPADGDKIATLDLQGNHDGSVSSIGAFSGFSIEVICEDVSETSEDTRIEIKNRRAGANVLQAQITDGLHLASMAAKGAGTLNAVGLFTRGRILSGGETIFEAAPTVATTVTIPSLKDLDSIDDAFEAFILILDGILPATDDDELRIRLAVGAGAIDTGANYDYVQNGRDASGTNKQDGGDAATGIVIGLSSANNGISNAAGEGLSAVLHFTGVRQNTPTNVNGVVNYHPGGTGTSFVGATLAGRHVDATDELDDIELSWVSGGNFQAVGNVTLKGIRRAAA